MAGLYRVRSFSPSTRVYGVLGTDVMRSLSPEIHNRAFAACGLDAIYVPLQAEALTAFLEALPALGLSGFSVTRPYKWHIVPYLDEVDDVARAAGSVNTVSVVGSRLVGTSTDGEGVTLPLYARDLDKALVVAGELGVGAAALDTIADQPWDILLNATPVGSGAMPGQSLLPPEAHRAGTIVFDMVYEPLETPLLRDAREAGALVIDGLQMLVAQAVGQFQIWTGGEAPVDVMEAAAYGAAARAVN
jgi:shikimate 5-dehydrogenase